MTAISLMVKSILVEKLEILSKITTAILYSVKIARDIVFKKNYVETAPG